MFALVKQSAWKMQPSVVGKSRIQSGRIGFSARLWPLLALLCDLVSPLVQHWRKTFPISKFSIY